MTLPVKFRKFKAPIGSLLGDFRAETFNEDDRTVEIIWTTGARVKRFSFFDGEFLEELGLKKNEVNLDRLNKGAPVLNNHSSFRLEDNIGVVRKAWILKGQGHALIQFSGRDEVRGIVEDVRDGILKNISVGYRVEKFEDVSKKKDETPIFRAVDWTPMELSLVNIPADEDSQIRSLSENNNKNNHYDCKVFRKEIVMTKEERKAAIEKLIQDLGLDASVSERMIKDETLTFEDCQSEAIELAAAERKIEVTPEPEITPEPEATPAPVVDEDAVRDAGKAAELERSTGITSLVESVGLERIFADKLIKESKSIEDARSAVIVELARVNAEKGTNSVSVEVGVENENKRREACVRALQHRDNPSIKLESGDNAFLGGSILDTAREYLAMSGANVRGLYGVELAKRALHHSSDFPLILEDLSNKSIQAAYNEQPQSFQPFTRERSVSDFKDISSTRLGEGSGLEKVNEHGEYKKSTLSESAEKYKVEKYGKILGFTWELLLNDDLDAFARIPAILGRKVRALESELIWKIITSNPIMGEDGKALFHADHGNLTTGPGTAMSVASFGVEESKMMLQTEQDGSLIRLKPRYVVVPSALKTKAQQLTTSVTAQKEGDVNPYSSELQTIVEPLLDADSALSWYMFADKSQLDMIELARLDGKGPEIFTREGFNVDGHETKIRYVFGVKALDFRGFNKNVGA